MGGADSPGGVVPLPRGLDAVDLRHLRAFVAVAGQLNFTRAADQLHLSGPAISRQIRALERAVGCPLLRRSTHRVELTLAGEALLTCAREVLDTLAAGVSSARAVGGELDARIAALWEPILAATGDLTDLRTYRAIVERLHAEFPLDPEVETLPVTAGGVPALHLRRSSDSGDDVVVFVHGGGFISGSAFGYRATAAALTHATPFAALLPEYRLAPEHPFPAALDDLTATYLWLLDQGTDPASITVAGDSAGAALVLSLLLRLRQRRLPSPAGAALLSPWTDLTGAAYQEAPDQEPQPVLGGALLRRFASYYLGGLPPDDPAVALAAADLTGLPPLLVQAGTGDGLLHDATTLAEQARRCGVDCRLQLYPMRTHDFQLFWSFSPEAAEAMARAGRFLHRCTTARREREALA